MPYPGPFAAHTERERQVVDRASAAAAVAAPYATQHDRDGTFPVEGLAELARNGYLAQVVPSALGGQDASVAEMVLGSLTLARGDASLGLVVAMHTALLGRVRDGGVWPAAHFERVAREIAASRAAYGALINSLASEPEMGSPSRGGLPATVATRTPDGFRISGCKTFSSGSPVLRWGLVSATVRSADAEPYPANFLLRLATPGVRIEPTWDSLGMRATGSHTLVFDDVFVDADAEMPRVTGVGEAIPYERAWSLTVAAVYLGVAEAARDFALNFARTRTPSALGGRSIASLSNIRERAGRMDLLLYEARGLLVSLARTWDARPSADFQAALAATKVVVTNNAVAAVEQAMRLVGGSSLDRAAPLERHYRDVRGGLHHPPQDDAALGLFAREALD
ncbi:MAG TPA: acyl-CoA dehydrogenase family protein [Chloroflexota bacterium]